MELQVQDQPEARRAEPEDSIQGHMGDTDAHTAGNSYNPFHVSGASVELVVVVGSNGDKVPDATLDSWDRVDTCAVGLPPTVAGSHIHILAPASHRVRPGVRWVEASWLPRKLVRDSALHGFRVIANMSGDWHDIRCGHASTVGHIEGVDHKAEHMEAVRTDSEQDLEGNGESTAEGVGYQALVVKREDGSREELAGGSLGIVKREDRSEPVPNKVVLGDEF